MRSWLIGIGIGSTVLLAGAPAAQAQMTVDAAKITCRQLLLGQIGTSTRSIANWLSGYYHGKSDKTVIDITAMKKNLSNLEHYCRKHHDMSVMDAAKEALGVEK